MTTNTDRILKTMFARLLQLLLKPAALGYVATYRQNMRPAIDLDAAATQFAPAGLDTSDPGRSELNLLRAAFIEALVHGVRNHDAVLNMNYGKKAGADQLAWFNAVQFGGIGIDVNGFRIADMQ